MKHSLQESTQNAKDFSLIQPEKCLQILETVYLTRAMTDKMDKLVRQNKGGTFHLCTKGHELIGAVAAHTLISKKDWGFPYYRDRGFALGLGCNLVDLLGAFLARATEHHSGGRMMPEHFSQKDLRIPVQSSCVGSQFLQAVGCAHSAKLRKTDEVVYVSCGDGATSQGDFHEALNFSSLHKLPVIFVVQDNGWAISVPVEDQTSGGCISRIANSYQDVEVYTVDGCDFFQSTTAMHKAVQRARSKQGPSVICAKVPRMGPHSSSDDPKKYKSDEEIQKDLKKDPIPLFEKWLLDLKITTEDEIKDLKKECFQKIEEAAQKADQIPFPEPSTVTKHVFKDFKVKSKSSTKGEAVVMMDALNHALDEEMERDPHVIVFGQDVAKGKGGVFGITKNLTDKFGKERCFNTPLAESTIIGLATGISFDGIHKCVAEIQFADYHWTGVNQLFNELASIHYRSNGQWNCPVVIRMPYGGYIQGGPYHSQSIEAFISHCPGLKLAIPSNASDAKRLLKTAIRDPNPVIFLEHKALYRQRAFAAREEPGKDELLEFGKAKILKEGTDVTVVCYGLMAMMAADVVEQLKKEISVELIDLRTIVPFDMETISQSLKKTGKLLVFHEAAKTSGFGAEIAARAVEECFMYLDAPVMRLAGANTPVPYSKVLEDEVLPQKKDLLEAIRKLASF